MSKNKSPENYERLLKHLKDGSLAARLVQACKGDCAARKSAMTAVLEERLKEVREKLGNPNKA